jgi:CubicO group peptidase (beta-lactamase class C family)
MPQSTRSRERSGPVSPPDALSQLLRAGQGELRLPSLSAAASVNGELVWQDWVGVADVASGAAPTPSTQYRVGSITKTFTAAAVVALRDEGKLRLDDPLAAYVHEAEGSSVTLRRMLAHSSGLQREVPGDVWISLEFPQTAEELVSRLAQAEQVLDPGAHWHYSNLAFALLGEVVRRASGTPLERFVEERFIGPLELERTTWLRREPAARGYYAEPWSDAVRAEAEVESSGAAAAAGDLWSTPADLCRWADFLAGIEEMHAVQVMVDPLRWTLAWGLGLMLHRREDHILFGHSGAMPGFISSFAYDRRLRAGVAVVANGSTPATGVELLALELADVTLEAYPADPEPWLPGEPPPAELEGVPGRWWSEGTEFTFHFRSGHLEAEVEGPARIAEPAVFESEGPDRYRTVSGRERGELLVLLRDESGAVSELRWATYRFTRAPETFAAQRSPAT